MNLPPPKAEVTAVTVDQCVHCPSSVVRLSVDCPVPTVDELRTDPVLSAHCVVAARFRWCHNTFYFAAWLGAGDVPDGPGLWTPFLMLRR